MIRVPVIGRQAKRLRRFACLVLALALTMPATARGAAPLPPVYYQLGANVYAAFPDGSGAVPVATVPVSATVQPELLPDGRLLSATANGFATFDSSGRQAYLRTPNLNAGESVWSITPSPDGTTLAWQLVAPAQLAGYSTNAGSTRIVLTSRFGDAGTTVFGAQANSANDGELPVVLGWRPASPFGTGGATLLLQYLYSQHDPQSAILPNSRRGLLEYDPSIRDVVNDYLPPLSSDLPLQRAFAIAPDGGWTVYGDANGFTPSGEGPLAHGLVALNLTSSANIRLDNSSAYPSKQTISVMQSHSVKKRVTTREGKRLVTRIVTSTVSTRVPLTLRLYQYFSHHAYIAPGDGRVLYTLLTVSYPPGARLPRVQSEVLVTTMDGRQRGVVAPNAVAAGWLDGHTAVVSTASGLYAVNAVFGGSHLIAAGAARFIGVRTH